MVGHFVRCRTFIGRRAELSALVSARKSLSKSDGSFVLISGDAGIGKSRLLAEFVSMSRDRRARHILAAECLRNVRRPFGPFRAAIRMLVSHVALRELPKNVLRALIQLAPESIDAQLAAGADGALEKDELFEALAAFFRIVCAKRATILTIEDIHWADDSTLELLEYFARRLGGMRLLVVATYRSDELDHDAARLRTLAPIFKESSARQVRVEPLAWRELHALVEGAIDGRVEPARHTLQDIEERSEGNPFFAEELVKDLLDRAADPHHPPGLPASIRAMIADRFSRLTPDDQTVLECAAVLGPHFAPADLARVLERSLDAVLAALRRGRDFNLIAEDGPRGDCAFRHALTRQAIYEEVPAFQARALHARILASLESRPEGERNVDAMAYHAWRTGDLAKSARYNEQAGDAAFSVRALPEALVCFERALEGAKEPGDRARLYERIGTLERLRGRFERASAALESALALRLARGEMDAAAALATSIVGQMYNMDNESALPRAERFLDDHRDRLSASALGHLLVVCARVACALYDFAAAERYLAGVVEPDALSPNARFNYLIVQLMRHAYAGNAEEWMRYARQVDDLIPSLAPESVIGVSNALALTGIYIGANDQIERALQRSERVEWEYGFRAQRLYFAGVKAAYTYQRGRLAEALACVREVADTTTVETALRVVAPIAIYLALALGDDALWRRIEGGLLDEARGHLNNPDCLFLVGAHAALAANRRDWAAALTDLRAAVGALEFATPDAMYVLINAARTLPLDESHRVVEMTNAAANRGAASRATDLMVKAVIAARAGESAAADFGGEAATAYAELGWPLLEAAALELAGKRELAARIYERCGAVGYLKRAVRSGRQAQEAEAELTAREREITKLIASGFRNAEIARRLDITVKTVEKHISSVYRKVGVRSRAQLVASLAARPRAS